VDEFGDTALLARLIRRAKKRCRPLWLKIMIRSLQVLGIVVLYMVLCASRFFVGRPTIKVDYIDWLNQTVSQGRDESLNARYDIEAALAHLPEQPDGLVDKVTPDMNDADRARLETYLADCQPAFNDLRRAAKKPFYWNQYPPLSSAASSALASRQRSTAFSLALATHLTEGTMPALAGRRKLAFALRYRIQYETLRGHGENALQDSLVLMQLGRKLSGTGLLIEEMVGTALTSLGNRCLLNVLAETDVNEPALSRTYTVLSDLIHSDTPWISFDAEKVFVYDMIQRGFTDDGHGNGRILSSGIPLAVSDPRTALKDFLLFDFPDRQEVTRNVETFYDSLNQSRHIMPWQQLTDTDQNHGAPGVLLDPLNASSEKIIQQTWSLRTSCEATLAVIAIKKYRKIHHQLPDSLKQLVDDSLMQAVPRDYFGPGPLIYRPTGSDFLLYSRGEDLRDNGGTAATDDKGRPQTYGPRGDWIFWPPK